MATTYNFTNGSLAGQVYPPATRITEQNPTIIRNILDFSLQNIEAGASDVAQALAIPADTTILDCFLRVITAETADATVSLGYGDDADYFGAGLNVDAIGVAKRILTGSATWDASSIPAYTAASGTCSEAKNFTVAGAALGDIVTASPSIDITDLTISASVTTEDTVTVTLTNPTGAAVNLASMTMFVTVMKAPLVANPIHFAVADTIDITATTTNGDVDLDGLKVEVTALCIKQLDSY